MITYLTKFVITFLIFLGIDGIWLGLIAKNFYSKTIGHLLADKANLLAALVFYILYVIGIIVFAINPALHRMKSGCVTAVQ